MTRLALACALLVGCGAPFDAAPTLPGEPIDAPDAAPHADASPDAPPAQPDGSPDASPTPDAMQADAPASPDASPDACAPSAVYQCGLNLLSVQAPDAVCLLSDSDEATAAPVPPACRCDDTCACLLASGAFCAAAQCSTGSGYPIIRGCT